MNPPEPSWRKPAGVLLILLLIALWAVIVVSVAEWLEGLHWTLLLVYYVIAGTVWIIPLKPLLRWMEGQPQRPDQKL